MVPSTILIVFLVLNDRRFLFSSANVILNETLNACLNERPHEDGYKIQKDGLKDFEIGAHDSLNERIVKNKHLIMNPL